MSLSRLNLQCRNTQSRLQLQASVRVCASRHLACRTARSSQPDPSAAILLRKLGELDATPIQPRNVVDLSISLRNDRYYFIHQCIS